MSGFTEAFKRLRVAVCCLLAVGCCGGGAAATAAEPPPGPLPAAAAPPGESADIFTVPFRYERLTLPQVVVYVSVKGSEPLPFLLDTGTTSAMLLDSAFARQAKIKERPETITLGPGAIKAHYAEPFPFEIPGSPTAISGTMPRGVIADLSEVKKTYGYSAICGIVGADFFRASGLVITLDFAEKKLTLYRQAVSPFLKGPAPFLPLTRTERGLYTLAVTFGSSASGSSISKTTPLILDTGSPCVLLSKSAREHIAAAAVSFSKVKISDVSIDFEGKTRPLVLLRSDLTVGGETDPNFPVWAFSADEGDSLLGLTFLERCRTTIDFSNNKIRFEKLPDRGKSPLPGPPVALLSQKNGSVFISAFPADSPGVPTAEAARSRESLKIADEILSVDGVVLSDLPLSMAQQVLNGYAGTTGALVLRRDGKTVTVTLSRPSPYD